LKYLQWPITTLEQICLKIGDGSHYSPSSVSEGLPMASVKDLTTFGITIESCRHILEDDFNRLVRQGSKPVVGDVLIAKDGATALDTVCEVKQPLDIVLLSSIAILRPNPQKVTSTYLRYFLESPTTRSYMKGSFISGAAIPRVVLKDFKRVNINIPPLITQRKIAAILSAYDDLIENNLKRIRILEKMAQNIYHEWFVNFRFPGYENVKMVDSVLGMVPDGWEVKQIGELLDSYMGGDWGSEVSTITENVPVIIIRGADLRDLLCGSEANTPRRYIKQKSAQRKKLREGDIIVENSVNATSRSVGTSLLITRGLLNRLREDAVPASFCKRFSPKYPDQGVLIHRHLQFLRENHKMEFYQHVATNGIANFQCERFVQNELLAIPQKGELLTNILKMLNDISSSSLADKIDNLRQTRDLLLPKLISGEIDVSDLDIKMREPA